MWLAAAGNDSLALIVAAVITGICTLAVGAMTVQGRRNVKQVRGAKADAQGEVEAYRAEVARLRREVQQLRRAVGRARATANRWQREAEKCQTENQYLTLRVKELEAQHRQ